MAKNAYSQNPFTISTGIYLAIDQRVLLMTYFFPPSSQSTITYIVFSYSNFLTVLWGHCNPTPLKAGVGVQVSTCAHTYPSSPGTWGVLRSPLSIRVRKSRQLYRCFRASFRVCLVILDRVLEGGPDRVSGASFNLVKNSHAFQKQPALTHITIKLFPLYPPKFPHSLSSNTVSACIQTLHCDKIEALFFNSRPVG